MVRRRALSLVVLLAAAIAAAVRQEPPFEDEIRRFEAADRAIPPAPDAILFVGSSSIRLWSTLAQDFPDYRVLNRGFGGSQIADSVRYADRIVTPYRPRAIVFFAGSNDLAAGKSPETVASDYRTFVERVRAKLPTMPIAFIAISPAPSRWSKIREMRKANELIRAYSEATPGLGYIDTFAAMTNAIGGPRPDLYGPDNLHLNAKGYAVWRAAVAPVLRDMAP